MIAWEDVVTGLAVAGGLAAALGIGRQLRSEDEGLAQQERTDDLQESSDNR